MRNALVGLLAILSPISVQAVELQFEQPVCAGEFSTQYPCAWQRKVMLAEQKFAAQLEARDETITGSITQTDR